MLLLKVLFFYPFSPLVDDADVYFLQYAVSWGQLWTQEQWAGFREWYNDRDRSTQKVPNYITEWGKNTWKRYYTLYMMETGKYFVCPKSSFTSNTGEPGVHFDARDRRYEVELVEAVKDWKFVPLDQSSNRFDAWFELEAEVLKTKLSDFKDHDLELDLYGLKTKDELKTELVLTTQPTKSAKKSFGMVLKPPVENVLAGIPGNTIKLSRVADLQPPNKIGKLKKYIQFHRYYNLKPRLQSQLIYRLLLLLGLIRKD